jgi:hypothetical protein
LATQSTTDAVGTYETVTTTVEAIKLSEDNLGRVVQALVESESDFVLRGGELVVDDVTAAEGDWIVWYGDGTVRVQTDKSFRSLYEV